MIFKKIKVFLPIESRCLEQNPMYKFQVFSWIVTEDCCSFFQQVKDKKQMPSDWPSKEECDTYVQKTFDPQNMSTVYLPPENKGFE